MSLSHFSPHLMTTDHAVTKPDRMLVLGAPDSARAFEIRDFLSRTGVPYDWVQLDGATAAGPAGVAGLDDTRFPWPLQRPPYYLETSVPGSFAIGDVRHGSIKRVATAVGEGAMAVAFIHQYLRQA